MNDNRNVTRSAKAARTIKQSAMTRAVRSVLAASALTLALGATSGTAAAAAHKVPMAHALQLQQAAIDFAPVVDMSLIAGGTASGGIMPPGGPVMTLIPGDDQSTPGNLTTTVTASNFVAGITTDDIAGFYASVGGDADITNQNLQAAFSYNNWDAFGVLVTAGGSATIDNQDFVYARATGDGYAYGLYVWAGGDITIDNSGRAVGKTDGAGHAYGIYAYSRSGDITINSTGLAVARAYGDGDAFGIYAGNGAADGDITITVDNDSAAGWYNDAKAYGAGNAYTVYAWNFGDGDISITHVGDDFSAYAGGDGNATGIFAHGHGDIAVTNSGAIDVQAMGAGTATGIHVRHHDGAVATAVSVTNSGDVSVWSSGGDAFGLYVDAFDSAVTVTNTATGSIIVGGLGVGSIADGIFAYGDTATVNNAGYIYAYGGIWASGIEAGAATGAVTVNNAATGDIVSYSHDFQSQTFGIYAYSLGAAGTATVNNAGSVGGTAFLAGSYNEAGVVSWNGYATGIYAYAPGGATVNNAATGVVNVYGYLGATGIDARAANPDAAANVFNSGSVTAYAIPGNATGINAMSLGAGGTVTVVNDGDINAYQVTAIGTYMAYGISALADGDVYVRNQAVAGGAVGSIFVYGYNYGYGVQATSLTGTAVVRNEGNIETQGYNTYGADVFAPNGTAYALNTGVIDANGDNGATGIRVSGDVLTRAVNGNIIDATGKYAWGINAKSAGTGDVAVLNDAMGTITADGSKYAYGVSAVATAGDVGVENRGKIYATYTGAAAGKYAYGVKAVSTDGDVVVNNTATGTIAADLPTGGTVALGVFAVSDTGDATISNAGHLSSYNYYGISIGGFARANTVGTATAQNLAGGVVEAIAGVYVDPGVAVYHGYATGLRAEGDTAVLFNAGDVHAHADADDAIGLQGTSATATVVTNAATGTIEAHADLTTDAVLGDFYGNAIGISALSGGTVTVTNAGDIEAIAEAGAGVGVDARGNDAVVVNNAATGTIYGSGAMVGVGVFAYSVNAGATVNNAGAIHADNGALAAAVMFGDSATANTLNNAATGVIEAYGPDGTTWAVYGSNGVDVINNAGKIYGAIDLRDGNDVFNNNAGGLWDLKGTLTSYFGDDDTLVNKGTIYNDGAMAFGPGDDMFLNDTGGLLWMHGGLVTMAPPGPNGDAFTNKGTVRVTGAGNTIDAGPTGTITNTGLLDFHNHTTTADRLTLVGNLAGNGKLVIDVTQNPATADQLRITGNIAATAVQTVDVDITPLFPQTAHISIPFAWVTGTSVAGNFAPGTLIGYNHPLNFINLGFTIGSVIDTTNVVNDVFSINLDVNGLNDTGSIAALTAQGAANFMNAQVGTFRQRLGVNPYGDAGKVMSAYVRYYTETGDVNPGHNAHNFGQGGNFDYRQASWGTEVGVNANLWSNLHAGVVLGNADSRQRLTNPGVGTNRMDGMTFGMYMTWYVPSGWYVDLTARKMAADVYSTSVGGVLQSRVHTNAVSLEGGYEFKVGNINIVPQIQYTWTQVDEIDPYHGQLVDLNLGGGHYNRGRVGVDFNTQIESGDFRWTPYGSLNWVHNSRGASEYNIGGIFHGDTWVNGSAFMAEFGVGVERGGFGFTIGGNWTDGGSYDSVLGGQASFRYSW